MAKVQIRKGYKAKTIDKDLLSDYLKDGWGEVIIHKSSIVDTIDYKKGQPIKVKQKQTRVEIKYAVTADIKAKDVEIEALKKQLAESMK